MLKESCSSSGRAKIWVGGGGGSLYIIHALTHIMWIYNIWNQFEKIKSWVIFNVIIPKKKLYKKMLIHNIVFIYWDISHMNDLFLIFFRAKTQVMNY